MIFRKKWRKGLENSILQEWCGDNNVELLLNNEPPLAQSALNPVDRGENESRQKCENFDEFSNKEMK